MQKRTSMLILAAVFYFVASIAMTACASNDGMGNLADPPTRVEKTIEEVRLSSFDEQQIRCLAENVYHEARGEPIRGQEAVALVVRNRVASGQYPSTFCEVVWDRNRRGCQFSWTCDGRSDRINDHTTYNEILERMRRFYVENPVDFTNGSEYYHANYVRPSWSRVFQRTVQIGTHIFYRG